MSIVAMIWTIAIMPVIVLRRDYNPVSIGANVFIGWMKGKKMKNQDVKIVINGAISVFLLGFVPSVILGQEDASSLPPLPSLPTIPRYDSPGPESLMATLPPLPDIEVPIETVMETAIEVAVEATIEPATGFRSSYKKSTDEYIVYAPDELFATNLVSKAQFERMTSNVVQEKPVVPEKNIITQKVEEKRVVYNEKPLEVIEFIPPPPTHLVLPPLELVMEEERNSPLPTPHYPLPLEPEIEPAEEEFAFAASGAYVPLTMPLIDDFQSQYSPPSRPQEQERVAYRNNTAVTPNINATPTPQRNVLATPTEERSGPSFFSLKNMKNPPSSDQTMPPSKTSSALLVRSDDLPPSPIQATPVTNSSKVVSAGHVKSQPSIKTDSKPTVKPSVKPASKPTLVKSNSEKKSSGSSLSDTVQPVTDEMKKWGTNISTGIRSINPFSKDK